MPWRIHVTRLFDASIVLFLFTPPPKAAKRGCYYGRRLVWMN